MKPKLKERWKNFKERHPWVKPVMICLGALGFGYGCYYAGYFVASRSTDSDHGPDHDQIWHYGIALGESMGSTNVIQIISGHCPEAMKQIVETYRDSFNFKASMDRYFNAYGDFMKVPENQELGKYLKINI